MSQPDDPEDLDPGLAWERTRLAWIRTAIGFAAVGGALLKVNVAAGATALAMAPFIWLTGRYMSRQAPGGQGRPRLLLLTAVAVTAVALVVLLVVLLGNGSSPGFHPPSRAPGVSG